VQSLLSLPPGRTHPLSLRASALVFEDPRSRVVLDTLARIAPSGTPALIIGAAGTGKELAARHLHQASGRSGPFVSLNCASFDEHTVEAELFGTAVGEHPRGGWIEAAHGGTLFLDEIGDLPPALQSALVRMLETRQVVRVGARSPVDVDVRLVAASHVDLSHAVAAGRFRRELWYRLSVATLQLPALAERPGDIVPLARHFMQVWCARLGLPQASLSADGIAALQAYSWPGNIRELENVITHALLVGSGGLIAGYGYGDQSATANDPTWPVPNPNMPGVLYFPETQHSLRGVFRGYWERYGGLAQFGYPLTEEFDEVLADGKTYQVQYFERARFESHSENAAPYDVLFGLLGSELRDGTPAPRP